MTNALLGVADVRPPGMPPSPQSQNQILLEASPFAPLQPERWPCWQSCGSHRGLAHGGAVLAAL